MLNPNYKKVINGHADLRMFANGTYIARLHNVPNGKLFRHCKEDIVARKTCDAYQVANGKEIIFGVNDLVEVWK